jgi:hypothetical protein
MRGLLGDPAARDERTLLASLRELGWVRLHNARGAYGERPADPARCVAVFRGLATIEGRLLAIERGGAK